MKCLRCGKSTKRTVASTQSPYRFVESGLEHVYLSGIEVYVCPRCGSVHPVIPNISGLHQTVATALATKKGPLVGEEIRFLRKVAGLTAAKFAQLLLIKPETLSRAENNHQTLGPSLDKLARAVAMEPIRPGIAKKILKSLIEQKQESPAQLPLFSFDRGWKAAA